MDGPAGAGIRRRLLLAGGRDEITARQRPEVRDQRVRFHDLIQIDVRRHRERRGAGRDIQHLASLHIPGLAGMPDQGSARASFQDDQFALSRAVAFENHRRAGHRHGHGAGPDGAAAGILRHAEENRAAVDLDVAPGPIETEDRV